MLTLIMLSLRKSGVCFLSLWKSGVTLLIPLKDVILPQSVVFDGWKWLLISHRNQQLTHNPPPYLLFVSKIQKIDSVGKEKILFKMQCRINCVFMMYFLSSLNFTFTFLQQFVQGSIYPKFVYNSHLVDINPNATSKCIWCDTFWAKTNVNRRMKWGSRCTVHQNWKF